MNYTREFKLSTDAISPSDGLHMLFVYTVATNHDPSCQIVEWEYFSDFTPTQINCVCKLDSNWRVGSKWHSLLSALCLIGAYFFTNKSDKCMHLLTGLYSTSMCEIARHPLVKQVLRKLPSSIWAMLRPVHFQWIRRMDLAAQLYYSSYNPFPWRFPITRKARVS